LCFETIADEKEEFTMQKIENKVVVHLRDGRIIKGNTYDFNTSKETFHVADIQNFSSVRSTSQ